MSMTPIIPEEPLWTDVWQTIAALIAIPGAIAAFIILFIKDKNKDNQIQKLSDIASHLSKMVADSEKRHIISRKPWINIEVHYDGVSKEIVLWFVNSNPNTTVSSFSAHIQNMDSPLLNNPVQDIGGMQRWNLNIPVSGGSEGMNVDITYYTSEGFAYIQRLTLTVRHGKAVLFSHPLLHESE